jgi:hypothetical protein
MIQDDAPFIGLTSLFYSIKSVPNPSRGGFDLMVKLGKETHATFSASVGMTET